MFFAVAMACIFSALIPVEQSFSEVDAHHIDEVQVRIHLEGEIARRYIEQARSPSLCDSFEKNGNLFLSGVATVIDDNTATVRHTSIVRVVGQPIKLLSMQAVVERAMLRVDPDAPIAESPAQSGLIRLTDIHPIEIQVRSITGGFPDSPRYN